MRHTNYPLQVADAIARDHSDAAWAIISKLLELDDERRTWLELWLGEEISFDDDKIINPITVFNPNSVMAWTFENPTKRTRTNLTCLPKTLDEKKDGSPTRLFIGAFGDGKLGNSLISRFRPTGWSGPESSVLAKNVTRHGDGYRTSSQERF